MSNPLNTPKEMPLNLSLEASEPSRDMSLDRLQQVQELLVGDLERSSSKRLSRIEDTMNEQSQRIDALSEQVTAFQVAIYDEFSTQAQENAKNLHALKEMIEQQVSTALRDGSEKVQNDFKLMQVQAQEQFNTMQTELKKEASARSQSLTDMAQALRNAADKIAQ